MADNAAFASSSVELGEVNVDEEVNDTASVSRKANQEKKCRLESERRHLNDTSDESRETESVQMLYSVSDVPPWYISAILGFQQYLTMFGGTLAAPMVVGSLICVGDNHLALSELIGTMFFVSGLATLLQTLLGNRLPIIQGGTFSFIAPIAAIMSLPEWKCPADLGVSNESHVVDAWKLRMCEVQGAVICASIFEVIIGFTGLIGLIMRFIGPLTIAPTISLIGLSLVSVAVTYSSAHWGVAFGTIALIALFSQYLRHVVVPICTLEKRKCVMAKFHLFSLFPVIMSICLIWLLCHTLTVTNVFPNDPSISGYKARTDTKLDVLRDAAWFRFPYPGQWGVPTVSVAGVFGMVAGVLASTIESIGDYYACARLSGAPPPPMHALNRGICVEGVACVLAGALGSGTGVTSYSENVGAIGITKVGSRRVIEVAGCLMVILGVFGKFGALFVTLPDPIVGGIFMTMFGMVTGVGLSNLQFVDLNSPRNLFVVGFAIIAGVAIPLWMRDPSAAALINTGSSSLDQIIRVLLSTSMFIGGVVAAILDNTIPGTDKERGIHLWNQRHDTGGNRKTEEDIYDLPYESSRWLSKVKVFNYIPICPTFVGWTCSPKRWPGWRWPGWRWPVWSQCCEREGKMTMNNET